VFDLDGTITRFDTLPAYLALCLAARPWRLPRLLLVLPALLCFPFQHDRGALKGSLIHAALGGLPRPWLARQARRFTAWLVRRGLYGEALSAIAAHRSRGDRLLLMTASTELYAPAIAAALGFPPPLCTRLRWCGERLEGHLAGPNCRGEQKRRELATVIEREAPQRVYAYGNSASDLPHLELAQEAYLVNGPTRAIALPPAVRPVRWTRRAAAVAPAVPNE
jgi:phosphatidylglycerophosphatase C